MISPRSTSRGRRTARLAALALVPLMAGSTVLAACGSSSDNSSSSTTGADTSTTASTVVGTTSLDQVEFSSDPNAEPTATFALSYVGDQPSSKVLIEGTGAPVAQGQRISLDYVVINGADGQAVNTTWGQKPQTVTADDTLQPAIVKDALVGAKVGSRIATAFDESGQWLIVVFDIRSATDLPASASGEEVPPVPGLPTVTFADGKPTVTIPEGDPPTGLVVQPLIKGTGPAVTAGQTLTVQYTGVIWGSGQVFDSSWDRGAPVDFPVGTGSLISGFEEGLIGQTVGSRVLIVIPPDKGYGAQGNQAAGISGTDTIVFVVDILAAA